MAVTGTLEQIRAKVRKITCRPSINQLSDEDLDNYINDFYVYDFPQYLKLWDLTNNLSPLMTTTTGGDRILTAGRWIYPIDWNKYTNIAPPFYVAGFQIPYFQDVASFLNYFPIQQVSQDLATGSGIAGPYAGTITNIPTLYDSVFITAVDATGNTVVASVDSDGNITGDVLAGGTVNLTTGAVAGLTFNAVIPAGNIINVQSITYEEGMPTAVLYYNKALVFYPVPDKAYEVYCTVNYSPDELGVGDQVETRQWWNLIALGAARKIFIDNLDMESLANLQPIFDEQKRLVERKTLQQLSTQRIDTIYTITNSFIKRAFY